MNMGEIVKKTILSAIGAMRSFLDKAEASLVKDESCFSLSEEEQGSSVCQSANQPTDAVDDIEAGSVDDSSTSTHKDRIPMNRLLGEWSGASGQDLKNLKAILRKWARVQRFDHMTVAQVGEACAWIKKQMSPQGVDEAHSPAKTEQHRLPIPRNEQGKFSS